MNTPPVFPANPYVGPRTFTRAEGNLFFGREREAQDLLALVISQRLVLFYAQSGAGKSSLINTRLIPQLQTAGFAVLPVGRVGGELPTGLEGVANIFLFNLMLSLDQSGTAPQHLVGLTLPAFLAGLTSEDGERWQYEAPSPINEVAELVGDSKRTYKEPSYVLIIDQFEEIITTHLHRWPERAAFFWALEEAMAHDPNLWVVLALREDYVAALDPYAQFMADKLRARFYMQRMGYAAALEAVKRPAAEIGRRPFFAGVAEQLVDNLCLVPTSGRSDTAAEAVKGEFVEPVQLQVVCYQLWERLQERQNSRSAETQRGEMEPSARPSSITYTYITEADLKQLAGNRDFAAFVNQALSDYYEQALRKTLQTPNLTLQERDLRTWFSRKLITPEGTRGLVYEGDEVNGVGGLPIMAARLLENYFLIRAEVRSSGRWYELTHDRFVQPILQANQAWELAQANPLTLVARLWLENGRDPQRLLKGQQLADAQGYALANPNKLGKEEQEFLEISTRHQAEETRRRQRTLALTALVLVSFALLAIWGLNRADAAERQEAAALSAAATAVAAGKRADAEAESAQQAKRLAEQKAQEAEYQTRRARAGELLAQAQAALGNFPQRSLLLAVEALAVSQANAEPHLPGAQEALRNALNVLWQPPLSGNHAGSNAMTVSPDSRWLAVAGNDGAVRLWDLTVTASDLPAFVLRGHEAAAQGVVFSPNNRWLVTTDTEGEARLWSLGTKDWTTSSVLLTNQTSFNKVVISADSQWLAIAAEDNTVRLRKLTAQDSLNSPIVLRGHTAPVSLLVFSTNSRWLATAINFGQFSDDSGTAYSDYTVRLWDLSAQDSVAAPLVLAPSSPQAYPNEIQAIAISPDSRRLLTARFGLVQLWDLTAGNLVTPTMELRGQAYNVHEAFFSANNHWLVLTGYNTTQLWDLTAAEPAASLIDLRTRTAGGSIVAIGSDNRWLATGNNDGTINLWDLQVGATQQPSLTLAGHESSITDLAISPDNRWLVSAGSDATVRLWDLTDQDPASTALTLRGADGNVADIVISPDSHWLFTRDNTGVVRRWDLTTQTMATNPNVLRDHSNALSELRFTPDGGWLVATGGYDSNTGQSDSTVRIWDLISERRTISPTVIGGEEAVIQPMIAISSDNHWLATVTEASLAQLWDLRVQNSLSTPINLDLRREQIAAVAVSPDAHWLVIIGNAGRVYRWNLQVQDIPSSVMRLEGIVSTDIVPTPIIISPDSRWLAVPGNNHIVKLWDLTSSDPNHTSFLLRGHTAPVSTLAISTDNRWLVTASGHSFEPTRSDPTVRLWDLTAPNPSIPAITLDEHNNDINGIMFSLDKRWLVTYSYDTVRLWDMTTQQSPDPPVALRLPRRYVSQVAISPNSHWLVTAGDNILYLWDLTAVDPTVSPMTLRGHTGSIQTVAFSPDSHWLATGAGYEFETDHIVRLWDLTAERPAESAVMLQGHAGNVTKVAFSPDNQWLASASTDRTVRLWNLNLAALMEQACQAAGRNLTWEEWAQYFPGEPYRPNCPAFPVHYTVIEAYLAEGDERATAGDITGALKQYQKALDFNPSWPLTPTVRANHRYAAAEVEQANELARSGEITAAVLSYQQALTLDPTLLITPIVEANQQYAATVVKQANELARSGEITRAVVSYQQALTLDPTLPITPTTKATQQYALALVSQAAGMARSGEITTAITTYTQALTLDPTMEIDVFPLWTAADDLASRGQITAAVTVYQQVLVLAPDSELNPERAAKRQAIMGLVENVMGSTPSITDTKAITDDIQQAIQFANDQDDQEMRLQICRTSQFAGITAIVSPLCQQLVASAKELTGTTIVSGSVTNEGGDVWKFEGKSGQIVTIWLKARDSDLGAYLRLYGPDFTLLDENDDTSGLDSLIEKFVLPDDGAYIINADGYESGTGDYTLDIAIVDE